MSAQQETALDWTPLIIQKTMTRPLPISFQGFLWLLNFGDKAEGKII